MRAAPVTVHGRASWTVVDGSGLPIGEIEQFLHWLRAVGRSQNTVRSYARHLSLFYRWLSARGIAWDAVAFDGLCDFVGALSVGLPPLQTWRGSRSAATVKAVSAGVREFYEFHRIEGRGPAELVLTATLRGCLADPTASAPTSSSGAPARSHGWSDEASLRPRLCRSSTSRPTSPGYCRRRPRPGPAPALGAV